MTLHAQTDGSQWRSEGQGTGAHPTSGAITSPGWVRAPHDVTHTATPIANARATRRSCTRKDSTCPPAYVQTPETHIMGNVHVVPQPPQFEKSIISSTQPDGQKVSPVGQPQTPLLQTPPTVFRS